MKHDLNQSLGEIHACGASMKEKIWEIQHHLTPRLEAQQWAKKLRFITRGRNVHAVSDYLALLDCDSDFEYDNKSSAEYDDDISPSNPRALEAVAEDKNSQATSMCACMSKMRFDTPASTNTDLYITAPGDAQDCRHYLAVSYRWPSRDDPLDERFNMHVEESATSRTNRAPARVLERALAFAHRHYINLVWVDQECIEQDNRIDKEFGIQSMDLVFQNAKSTVALLTCTINEQRHLDALIDLLNQRDNMTKDEVISGIEVLELILSDEWHTRAWCFQEFSVSDVHMTFLIPRHPDLVAREGSERVLDIPNEVAVDAFELLRCCSALWIPSIVVPDHYVVREWAVTDLATIITPSGQRDPTNHMSRYVFDAAQAIPRLSEKKHSRVPDALAILANLCDYRLRLDTMALEILEEQQGSSLSLSVCLYTLSIANGDLSILFDSRFRDSLVKSWVPSPLTRLNGHPSHLSLPPLRLQGCKIHGKAFGVTGILWSVDLKVSFPDFAAEYEPRWRYMDPDFSYFTRPPDFQVKGSPAAEDLFVEGMEDIIHGFHSVGYEDIAYVLWNELFKPPPPQLLSEFERMREQVQMFGSLASRGLRKNAAERGHETDYRQLNPGIPRWIMSRCVQSGYVFLGCPTGSPDTETPITCLFDVDEPSVVLSPVQQGRRWHAEYEIGTPSFAISGNGVVRDQARDFCVLEVEGLVQGIWNEQAAAEAQREYMIL